MGGTRRNGVCMSLSDLKKTACWKLNTHLENLPPQKKIKGLTKSYDSKEKNAVAWALKVWCDERNLKLKEEHKFAEKRKFRFDWSIPAKMIAVEYEGGIFKQNTGHNTAKHYTKDTDKYNLAQAAGWRVVRVTALNYSSVIQQIELFL